MAMVYANAGLAGGRKPARVRKRGCAKLRVHRMQGSVSARSGLTLRRVLSPTSWFGEVDEISNAVVYVASDDFRYTIGIGLILNGELSNLGPRRTAAGPTTPTSTRRNAMNTRRHLTVRGRPPVCLVTTAALFVMIAGAVVRAAEALDAREIPAMEQPLPNLPGNSLTAVVVQLAPGARVPSHHHAGFDFAYVLSGTVRSQLNDGPTVDYRTG
jgi:hypothetical protein